MSTLTLDDLIAQHGVPDFVKIDGEGYEAEAFAGLSQPLPALSFAFTTIQREITFEVLSRLERLGDYVFNVSLGERHVLELPDLRPAKPLETFLRDAPEDTNSGDIYARRI